MLLESGPRNYRAEDLSLLHVLLRLVVRLVEAGAVGAELSTVQQQFFQAGIQSLARGFGLGFLLELVLVFLALVLDGGLMRQEILLVGMLSRLLVVLVGKLLVLK